MVNDASGTSSGVHKADATHNLSSNIGLKGSTDIGPCSSTKTVSSNSCDMGSKEAAFPASATVKIRDTRAKRKMNISVIQCVDGVLGADVTLPKAVVDEVWEHFANTLYSYFVGKRLAFRSVETYVMNTWVKFGIQRIILRNGFFLFKFATKEGMERVLENGHWLIRLVSIILNIWKPNTRLVKDAVKSVPVWVKLHDVPVVAYSEIGLSIIATNLGKPLMLDSATSDMRINPWGRNTHARVLIEISFEWAFVDSMVVAIPLEDGSGHSMETLSIEYEWQPLWCDTCKFFDHKDDSCPFKVKAAISVPKADDEFIQENNSEKNRAKKKHINDDLDFMELKNSFDKLRQEDSILEVVEDPKMVIGTGSSFDANNELMSLNNDLMKAQGLESGKDNKEADVVSSSKPKFSFGPLDLGDISDSDEDKVFASQEDYNMSSTGGGHQREEEEFNLYDDDYADQVRDLSGQIQEFRDFQLHHGGRK
ncbi:zinc knuckle CX2CX4HX4C containing protein [Tanacetum coccineum]|uniref:Zinc knuckle CX2CX4HX4C containing protein n=1 Tax=Tanacetum coccineum TaxID=301880 RepID=A0ABQ5C6J8_9ASTR